MQLKLEQLIPIFKFRIGFLNIPFTFMTIKEKEIYDAWNYVSEKVSFMAIH